MTIFNASLTDRSNSLKFPTIAGGYLDIGIGAFLLF